MTAGDTLQAACAAELAELAGQGRLRQRPVFDGPDGRVLSIKEGSRRRKLYNWASNDYLGGIERIQIRNGATRALRQYGPGAGAARLLAGGSRLHRRLELRLAQWLERQDTLLTSTGFQANLAAITCLADSNEDVIICDRLCHASTYDGIRLSAGRMLRFRHNDMADLDKQLQRADNARRKLVCVESVYSMDGDEAPLADIRKLCDRHDAILLVDEAHAIGVFGPGGRGLCAETGVHADVIIATCSKSLAAQGGFIAADASVVEWLVNRGRSFIYSTAPVPAAVGAAIASLDLLKHKPEMPGQLVQRAMTLRAQLRQQGWQVPEGRSPIVPVIIGDEQNTLELAGKLREAGHYAPAIRPPTVPAGACRLRLTVTLGHKDSDIQRLAKVMAQQRQAR